MSKGIFVARLARIKVSIDGKAISGRKGDHGLKDHVFR